MRQKKSSRDNKTTSALTPDLSFVKSARVITATHSEVDLLMVGCGGTGSHMAGAVARLMRAIKEGGKNVSALFIDPDFVEEKNIGRQNFCDAEVGYPKAQTLAARYSLALGLDIKAITSPFSTDMCDMRMKWNTLTVMVGCVDNAAARQEIARTLQKKGGKTPPHLWWLDCGNNRASGQALVGSTNDPQALKQAFVFGSRCQHLPSPAWQCPNLLEPQPEEVDNHKLSCAELALANAQGLNVNQRVAVEAADLLTRLLLTQDLRRFATYFDLNSGGVKNHYITEENINAFVAPTTT